MDTIRNNLLQCCSDIKDVSVSIVDALAPPDFALNSVLGKSDGLVSVELEMLSSHSTSWLIRFVYSCTKTCSMNLCQIREHWSAPVGGRMWSFRRNQSCKGREREVDVVYADSMCGLMCGCVCVEWK